MMNAFFRDGLNRAAGGLMVGLLALTAGCAAPSWSAKLTRYQQWPADAAGETYRIAASPQQQNNLEFESFADSVRSAIGSTGLVEAQKGVPARFTVNVDYGNPIEQRVVSQYADSYYGPFGWGLGTGYYGINDGWAGGMFYSPAYVNVPVTTYRNNLSVVIRDNRNQQAEVYRATAVSYSGRDDLAQQIPFLAQAVFDGFPGNNGQVIDIRYALPRQ